MSRVEQIEQAIQELTPEEFAQLARRVYALERSAGSVNWITMRPLGGWIFCWTKRTVNGTPEP